MSGENVSAEGAEKPEREPEPPRTIEVSWSEVEAYRLRIATDLEFARRQRWKEIFRDELRR